MQKISVLGCGRWGSFIAWYLATKKGKEVWSWGPEEDYSYVRAVAQKLDIPYYTIDFSKEYAEKVFSHFVSEYEKGRTPNPDVLCNSEIASRRPPTSRIRSSCCA